MSRDPTSPDPPKTTRLPIPFALPVLALSIRKSAIHFRSRSHPSIKVQNVELRPVFSENFNCIALRIGGPVCWHFARTGSSQFVHCVATSRNLGKKAGTSSAYLSQASPNRARLSASSLFASRAYIQTRTGNIASVKIVGHCTRNPAMMRTKPTYWGCLILA